MASGKPSNCWQISTSTSAWPSQLRCGATPRALSIKSCTAGESRPASTLSGVTGQFCSPSTNKGSRLVARTRSPAQLDKSSRVSLAAVGNTCSQLSRMSNIGRWPKASRIVCIKVFPTFCAMCNAEAKAGSIVLSGSSAANSKKSTPSANPWLICRPNSMASRVLPAPARPIKVIKRHWLSNKLMSRTS